MQTAAVHDGGEVTGSSADGKHVVTLALDDAPLWLSRLFWLENVQNVS